MRSRQSLPFGVYPNKTQLFPGTVHSILDTEVQLAAHDYRVWLARKLVEEVKADTIDLIVGIETAAYISE